MPSRFMHECEHPGCATLTTHRYCAGHAEQHAEAAQERRKQTMALYDKNRPAYRKLYDSRWQRYRRAYLAKHPFCVECKKYGIVTEATEVDHVRDHKGDLKLFWDAGNHQALCKSCHSRKTIRENSIKK
jgi:5-methylcytosine-specific restriction protein A